MIKNKKLGFTLLEMVVYIAIFSIIFTGFVGLFILVDRNNRTAIQEKTLQNAAIFLGQHLADSFSKSGKIDVIEPGVEGTGEDGTCTISTSVNINSASCVGRVNADAVSTISTSNTALGSSTITVTSIPAGMIVGDEILIINLKGTNSDHDNVGKYETKRIEAINGNVITLDFALENAYNGSTQKVVVQRIPNYSDVTVSGSGTLTANAWDGTQGGVLFFRSKGTLTVNSGGVIDMNSKGYRNLGNAYGTSVDGPGNGGETYNGSGYNGCNWNGTYLCPATDGTINGSEGGAGGSSNGNTPLSGSIGGGGGGGGWNFGYKGGYGGGGGYGTVGSGANNGSGTTGGNGGTSTVSNSGNGGGGGSYGDANLARLMMGSAGGFGDANNVVGNAGQTEGGKGGGIISIHATTITNSGQIRSNGGNSTDGGGGAGGSILLKAITISTGSNLVTATGGTSNYSGGVGRIAAYYSTSFSGTTSPSLNVYKFTDSTNQELDFTQYSTSNSIVSGVGSGTDGACTISSSVDINTSSCVGRGSPDAPSVAITNSTASGGTTLNFSSLPTGFAVGDEILIINLKGTSGNYLKVGYYETKTLLAVSGTSFTLSSGLSNSYDGTTQKILAQRIPNYSSVLITATGTLTASAWDGTKGGVLFFRSLGALSISSGGKIDMTGKGFSGATNTVSCAAANGEDIGGNGISGGGLAATVGVCSGVLPGGGGGGYGTTGSAGTAGASGSPGGGGASYGYVDLSQLFMGGGGADSLNSSGGTANGQGGGIIAIYANSTTISGTIVANGSASTNTSGVHSGRGGGAGGSIYIKTRTATLGSSLVTATGGSGASQSSGQSAGGNGGSGRIAIFYSDSLTGTTSPTAYTSQISATTSSPSITNIFRYQLVGDNMYFVSGTSTLTSVQLTDNQYITVTSFLADPIRSIDNTTIIGVRVTITIESTLNSNINTTFQNTYAF